MKNATGQSTRGVGAGSVVVGAGLLAVLVAAVVAWSGRAGRTEEGTYVIRMVDYGYQPSEMIWRVGEKVTLTFVNASDAHPGKPHEWMVGRVPNTEPTVFGQKLTDGFETPFFDDVEIEVVEGAGLSMLMAGGAHLTGKPVQAVLIPGGMDMSGMDMGADGDSGDADHGDTNMPGTDESGADHGGKEMAGMDMPGMDEHGGGEEGFMPVVEQSGHLTISFTVPNKPGLWTYGCFQQSGQHFLNGMNGTITVVEG